MSVPKSEVEKKREQYERKKESKKKGQPRND
jgi:hypothetical protein